MAEESAPIVPLPTTTPCDTPLSRSARSCSESPSDASVSLSGLKRLRIESDADRAAPSTTLSDAQLGSCSEGVLTYTLTDIVLGSGSYSTVVLAHTRHGEEIAVKLPDASRKGVAEVQRSWDAEIQVYRHLGPCRNITAFLGCGPPGGSGLPPPILLECARRGSLRDRLRLGPLPLAEARHVFVGVFSAVYHMHARGVLHRDIKPENILFHADGRVQLADVGNGLILAPGQHGAHVPWVATVFSPGYVAPELFYAFAAYNPEYTAKVDSWALGTVLQEMVTGRPPIDGELRQQPSQTTGGRSLTFAGFETPDLVLPEGGARGDPLLLAQLNAAMLALRTVQASARPTPADLLGAPFMQSMLRSCR